MWLLTLATIGAVAFLLACLALGVAAGVWLARRWPARTEDR